MKTLIYVLSTTKCGTKNLARCLKNIGVDAHHEILPVNDMIYDWTDGIFSSVNSINNKIEQYGSKFNKIILPYLHGDGYFADINSWLSWFYPMLEGRCIHITREPCRMVSGWISKGRYGITHQHKVSHQLYPPSVEHLCDDNTEYSMFEHWCRYWCIVNQYYNLAKVEHFRVEDFNTRAGEILNILYPEATVEQREQFCSQIQYTPTDDYFIHHRTWTNNMIDTYNDICGDYLKMFGYMGLEG